MRLGFALTLLVLATATSSPLVQGGQVFSQLFTPPYRGDHPTHDLHNHNHRPNLSQNTVSSTFSSSNTTPPPSPPSSSSSTVPHLDWNSQIGQSSRQNQGRQGATQFQPFQTFQQQQQQQFGGGGGVGPGCRSRDRVYLPDMQSFLIQGSLTYPEAIQACQACGSELVLVDGTNIDRFREAFTSLGLYGDQKLWIKSWFGESVEVSSACPAVQIDPLMGNRLTRKQFGSFLFLHF